MATTGNQLESLHGHNYAVSIDVEGDLTADSWVWDFGDLQKVALAIISKLDHRFMLQERSKSLKFETSGDRVVITSGSLRYEFPRSDVVVLPIDNTTAERLAEWITDGVCERFRAESHEFHQIRVGVEESPGRTGWYTLNV